MKQEKTDLRVIRTRKAIRDAFCAMIMEMDYQDITIKELTQRAMINRNTFYLHYDSIESLLRELQDEIAGEFIEKQVSYTKMADIRRMLPMHQWDDYGFTAAFLARYPQFADRTVPVTGPGQVISL